LNIGRDPEANISIRPLKSLKIKIALHPGFASLRVPLAGNRRPGKPSSGETASSRGFRVIAAGHNNIKHNPVFRGMVRRCADFLPKENLC
jgi:hypothetical protein